jgi:Sulfotransferase family
MSAAEFSYSRGEQLFHRIALGSSIISELAFDIEKARFGGVARKRATASPVFVAGLARAGTTVLTRILHEYGNFASPTYRDLPLPLAPNTWARSRLSANRTVVKQERSHNDGLSHNLDSPEAIEEVFWRTFDRRNYILADRIVTHRPTQQMVSDFEVYVSLVCLRYNRTRYLSKNNNNILRLSAICAAFPDAVLVHPFRDPLEHAASLLSQHRNAVLNQRADPFRLRFATWLGHHEFGLGHRPFVFEQHCQLFHMDPGTIDYWLFLWVQAYTWLLNQSTPVAGHQVFFNYDAGCANARQLEVLGNLIGLGPAVGKNMAMMQVGRRYDLQPLSQSLHRTALDVYEALMVRAI